MSCAVCLHHNVCMCPLGKIPCLLLDVFGHVHETESACHLVTLMPILHRHKIEKQYAEDTIKLARSISGKDEIG